MSASKNKLHNFPPQLTSFVGRKVEVSEIAGKLVDSYYVLTSAAFAQGQYEVARNFAQQASNLAQTSHDRWMWAYILSDLGSIGRALGNYAQAKHHYQASYAIRDEFNDPEGKASALNHLGQVAILQGEYDESRQLFLKALSLFRQINDKGGLSTSLNGLG